MAEIIVTIDAECNVTVEALGVRGGSCKALTQAIEKAIGETTADKLKPEFFATATQQQGANQNARG